MSFPYIEIHAFDPLKYVGLPGKLELQPFGILLATGVLFGSYMGRRFLDKYQMDEDTSRWYVFRVVVSGFILAHLINAILYEPDRVARDPLLLIKVWDGISSFGGIMGGFFTFIVMTWRVPRDIYNHERWMDMSVYALTPGYWFGRMGCSVVHDHIGAPTDFFMGVDFPAGKHAAAMAGGIHHDLGLYEALFLMPAIWIAVLLIGRMANRRDGLMTAVAGIMYSVPRFYLDTLRVYKAADPRYFGLTPAQYFAILMFGLSVYLLYKIYVRGVYTLASDGNGGYLPIAKRKAKKRAAAEAIEVEESDKPPVAKAKKRSSKKPAAKKSSAKKTAGKKKKKKSKK